MMLLAYADHYPLYCSMMSCNTPGTHSAPVAEGLRSEQLIDGHASSGNTGTPKVTPSAPGVLAISPERMRAALEPLLIKYKVDAMFVGHNHNAERTHAVADLSVISRGREQSDTNGNVTLYEAPAAPIHWVVGSGGADPSTAKWKSPHALPWLATQLYTDAREATNWGYAKVTANKTALNIVFVDAYRNEERDRVLIAK